MLYWGFTIKYFCPSVLWFLLITNTKADIVKPYSGYAVHWQVIGMIVPLLGLFGFLLNICFFLHDEPLDLNEFKDRFDIDFIEEWEDGTFVEGLYDNKHDLTA